MGMSKLSITAKKLPHSQVELKVSAPAGVLAPLGQKIIAKHQKEVEIKGFRKGHAPLGKIIAQVGEQHLQQEMLDQALNEVYRQALQAKKVLPVTPPEIKIEAWECDPLLLEKSQLKCIFTIDLMPEVKLGDYRQIKVEPTKSEDEATAVSDKEIDEIIDNLRRRKSSQRVVGRAARLDDLVEVSFKGKQDGVVREEMVSSHHPLVLGSKTMIPGFEDNLVGLKRGESKTFTLKFPADYRAQQLAGKEVEFEAMLDEVKEITLPELNDEFAADYGAKSVANLKLNITEQLRQEKRQAWQADLTNQVLGEVVGLLKVDLPPGLVKAEAHQKRHKIEDDLKKYNVTLEGYLQSLKKSPAEFEKELLTDAERTIKIGLALREVMRAEKIDPEDKAGPQKALDKLVASATRTK